MACCIALGLIVRSDIFFRRLLVQNEQHDINVKRS